MVIVIIFTSEKTSTMSPSFYSFYCANVWNYERCFL